jgi:RimJ/RimL family protein N-acetyltransferase
MQSTQTPPAKLELADSPVLFAVDCDEPEGRVTRKVRELVFTPENLQTFWKKASKFSTIFGSEIKSAEEFLNLFLTYDSQNNPHLNGLFWVVDDFEGVFYITNIQVELDAQVHYSFFSGRHRGRLELVQKMLLHIFDTYNFRRLSASIPKYAKHSAHHFCKLVGFEQEGVKRKGAQYKGDWFGVVEYGLLREELTMRMMEQSNG